MMSHDNDHDRYLEPPILIGNENGAANEREKVHFEQSVHLVDILSHEDTQYDAKDILIKRRIRYSDLREIVSQQGDPPYPNGDRPGIIAEGQGKSTYEISSQEVIDDPVRPFLGSVVSGKSSHHVQTARGGGQESVHGFYDLFFITIRYTTAISRQSTAIKEHAGRRVEESIEGDLGVVAVLFGAIPAFVIIPAVIQLVPGGQDRSLRGREDAAGDSDGGIERHRNREIKSFLDLADGVFLFRHHYNEEVNLVTIQLYKRPEVRNVKPGARAVGIEEMKEERATIGGEGPREVDGRSRLHDPVTPGNRSREAIDPIIIPEKSDNPYELQG
jgi:hypothetical protein